MSKIYALICALTVYGFTGLAFGQDAGTTVLVPPDSTVVVEQAPSAATNVLELLLQGLGAVLAVALVLLVRKAIQWFEAKTKIDIPLATEKMLESVAEKAVNYAKEKAHQLNQANKTKMKGPEKLEAALTFGLDLAQQYKLDEVARDKLIRAIEAQLGKERTNV